MTNATSVKKETAMGQRIKRARMLAGLSRKDLAENHGISTHTLQSWELGRNPINKSKATKFIEILQLYEVTCSVDWLLEGSGNGPAVIDNDFINYPLLDETVGNLISTEQAIQKEIDFFKTNNANAIVHMVTDDAMAPVYQIGAFVGGIKYINQSIKEVSVGHDCIVETPDGAFFRRLIKSSDKYLLVSNNNQTTVSDPVIPADSILSVAPIIWHRWKFEV
jgi:transcriptional regulator with XRE-family HTH domain